MERAHVALHSRDCSPRACIYVCICILVLICTFGTFFQNFPPPFPSLVHTYTCFRICILYLRNLLTSRACKTRRRSRTDSQRAISGRPLRRGGRRDDLSVGRSAEVRFSEREEVETSSCGSHTSASICQPGVDCMEISRNILWRMDSPPTLETVYQAVYSLYNNTNPAEPGKASLWLGELQRSVSDVYMSSPRSWNSLPHDSSKYNSLTSKQCTLAFALSRMEWKNVHWMCVCYNL